MGQHDQRMKTFLTTYADALVARELGIPVTALQSVENEPQPPPRERRLDKVWLAIIQNMTCYAHYEVQHSRDPDMAHRMHEYGVRLIYSRSNSEEWWPVLSIILWPRKVLHIPEPPLRIAVPGGQEIIWPFINIKVFEWDKTHLETHSPGILILAPLVPEVHVEDLALYAQRLYNTTNGMERETAGALFFTFVEEQYQKQHNWVQIREQVTQMLRKVGFGMNIIDEMILNTDIAQQGIQQAESKEAIKMISLLWSKRFGSIPSDIETAIQAAPIATLERMVSHFVEPTYTMEQARLDLGL